MPNFLIERRNQTIYHQGWAVWLHRTHNKLLKIQPPRHSKHCMYLIWLDYSKLTNAKSENDQRILRWLVRSVKCNIGATFKNSSWTIFLEKHKRYQKCEGTIKVNKTLTKSIVQMPQERVPILRTSMETCTLQKAFKNKIASWPLQPFVSLDTVSPQLHRRNSVLKADTSKTQTVVREALLLLILHWILFPL